MNKIVAQQDEICGECGVELPKGSTAYSDGYDNIRCADCYERDMSGDIYG